MEFPPEVTDRMETGSLVWTTLVQCAHDKDECVHEDAERSGPENNGCDGRIHCPEVLRECASEQQEGNLEHDGEGFHHMFKIPRYDSVKFALAMLTSLDNRPSHINGRISVQPLFAEHGEQGGE